MEIIRPLARKLAKSKYGHVIEHIRYGWNNYSFIFYIGSISAIVAGLVGVYGGAAVLITIAFFYYAGKFKRELDREKEKIEQRKKAKRGRK